MFSFVLNIRRLLKAIVNSWQDPEFHSIMVLALVTLVSGTVFYRNVEGWSWIDALYFSVATVSTVGYGDFVPQTTFGKFFTAIYIVVGVGVFVLFFTQLARAMIESQKSGSKGRKSKSKKEDKPQDQAGTQK